MNTGQRVREYEKDTVVQRVRHDRPADASDVCAVFEKWYVTEVSARSVRSVQSVQSVGSVGSVVLKQLGECQRSKCVTNGQTNRPTNKPTNRQID